MVNPACVLGSTFILGIILTSAGCTTMSLPEYTAQPASSYPGKRTTGTLDVAASAMTDPAEVEKYFGTNLLAEGVLPVLVIASNRGTGSYVINRQSVFLQAGGVSAGTVSQSPSGSDSNAAGVTAVGAVLMSPILQFSGFKMLSDAQVITRNLAAKELQANTVSPGEAVDGFVYFKVLPSEWAGQTWTVRVNLQELPTGNVTSVDVPL